MAAHCTKWYYIGGIFDKMKYSIFWQPESGGRAGKQRWCDEVQHPAYNGTTTSTIHYTSHELYTQE